ncbi:MAG: 2,5-diamino-6-(ribosylamino)-4(3H)-pyrimidinone 5'-phosphate reductase [Methanosphaera sp.]|nr:2,5-diamino-6-(ribosylamino)-4(3H)-pyrimidinone 5'-phosphate reductase [Methanosphaera sp.]
MNNNMKPYVHLNSAMTVDGKIATSNSSMNISGSDDLIRVHHLRKKYDGIMVGINTVLIDDPRLTIHKIEAERDDYPTRIIVDSNAQIPSTSRCLNNESDTILLISKSAPEENIRKLEDKCSIIIAGEKQVNLAEALNKLYSKGIKSILLEGGSTLNYSMLKEQLVDELSICIGSKILGGRDSKTLVDGEGFSKEDIIKLELKSFNPIDEDILLEYNVKYE